MPQSAYRSPFQPDHIISESHGGLTTPDNLCWACFHCNLHKGTNLSGIDPKSARKSWLFNPRRMIWSRHFRWTGPILVGRTPIGRATIAVLRINADEYVQTRVSLIAEGLFPPTSD
jgi:hypothetical protein